MCEIPFYVSTGVVDLTTELGRSGSSGGGGGERGRDKVDGGASSMEPRGTFGKTDVNVGVSLRFDGLSLPSGTSSSFMRN